MTDNLLAAVAAGEICELTETQWENYFYNTGVKLHTDVMKNKAKKA